MFINIKIENQDIVEIKSRQKGQHLDLYRRAAVLILKSGIIAIGNDRNFSYQWEL